MRKLDIVTDAEGVQSPAEPIPATALMVVCDGKFYHVAETPEDVAALEDPLMLQAWADKNLPASPKSASDKE